MTTLEIELAEPATVAARNPQGSLRAAEAVVPALLRALKQLGQGRPDDAIYDLNRPLMAFEPMAELLAWFNPTLINDAILSTAGGDHRLLLASLDAMGLLAQTGEAYVAVRPFPCRSCAERFGSAELRHAHEDQVPHR